MDRETLYRRIDERCEAMIDGGLKKETETLLNRGYSADLKPMKAIGYRHMVRYLHGDWSMDEAVSRLKRDTRRYAKRQFTWFRADPRYIWVPPDDVDGVLNRIRTFLSS